MTDQYDAVIAAKTTLQEGLQAYLNAIADAGEPEVAVCAVVFFESQGMGADRPFVRRSFVQVEGISDSQSLGLVQIVGTKYADDVMHRALGHEEEA